MTIANLLFDVFIGTHIATGFVGLAEFRIPVSAREGDRMHVQAGHVFRLLRDVVTLSAVTTSAGPNRLLSRPRHRLRGTGPTSTASSLFPAISGW